MDRERAPRQRWTVTVTVLRQHDAATTPAPVALASCHTLQCITFPLAHLVLMTSTLTVHERHCTSAGMVSQLLPQDALDRCLLIAFASACTHKLLCPSQLAKLAKQIRHTRNGTPHGFQKVTRVAQTHLHMSRGTDIYGMVTAQFEKITS